MNPDLEQRARAAFEEAYGEAPTDIAFAPGRVNLIGEHVDYNDGLVLPMPIPMGTAVAWSRTAGEEIEVTALDLGETDRFPVNVPDKPRVVGWQSYVRGMAAQWEIMLPGLRLLIAGDLPRGSGLSSSASLCIALGRAFSAASEEAVDPTQLARLAQETEHQFAGVACGIMDQMAVAAGQPGHAMLLDCRDLAFRHIALPENWAVLIVASGVVRGLVDGEYNARREQCELAQRSLGVSSLRDLDARAVTSADLPEPAGARARHVVGEIQRVKEAVLAMESSDIETFGGILRAGHASLRDDFEVSVKPVDALVDALNEQLGSRGGARMTGAGFGGSVVVVCEKGLAPAIIAGWQAQAVRVF